jgi:hypothetical protein
MKERELLYLEIPTYHDTVIILTLVLFISTQIDIVTYVQPYCFYRDSHHILHKEDPDLSPVLDEILTSVLFISTQIDILIYVQPYCFYRDSHHVLHKEDPDQSPVLDEILSIIKIPTGCTGVLFSFYTRRIHF